MAQEPKTKENDASVLAFIENLENAKQREESKKLLMMFAEITGKKPSMWGESIIGFGHYQYRYSSGREGTWMRGGFSPRKGKFSLYIMLGFDKHTELLSDLGKFKTGKSCLYINKLDDVDEQVLKALIAASFKHMEEKYPE